MILIEARECANSLDARKIERGHIEECNATSNVNIPSRTYKRMAQENKEMLAINNKNI